MNARKKPAPTGQVQPDARDQELQQLRVEVSALERKLAEHDQQITARREESAHYKLRRAEGHHALWCALSWQSAGKHMDAERAAKIFKSKQRDLLWALANFVNAAPADIAKALGLTEILSDLEGHIPL